MKVGLGRAWSDYLRRQRTALQVQRTALALLSPRARVDNMRQRVDDLVHRATSTVRHEISLQKAAVGGLIQTLHAVGPDTVLARGYSVVRNSANGTIIRSLTQVKDGDGLKVRVSDGEFGARASDNSLADGP